MILGNRPLNDDKRNKSDKEKANRILFGKGLRIKRKYTRSFHALKIGGVNRAEIGKLFKISYNAVN